MNPHNGEWASPKGWGDVTLPWIDARLCMDESPHLGLLCTRAMGHTGRHAAAIGPSRCVYEVWS